jgi:hypothetical protein
MTGQVLEHTLYMLRQGPPRVRHVVSIALANLVRREDLRRR